MGEGEEVTAVPVTREERRRERSPERRRERSPPRGHRDERDERRRGRNDERGERRERERDRDRDYKRRKSTSPPFRDRRHSPRSPPSKRPAYDPYDRPRGFAGDLRGPPDWSRQGRNSGFDVPPMGGYSGGELRSDFGGLLSYKQFILDLEDDVSPAEAQRRYELYKNDFIGMQKQAFFNQHKDEDWLREMYDPPRLEVFLVRRNENAQGVSKDYLDIISAGQVDVRASASMNREKSEMDEEESDLGLKHRRSIDGRSREREDDAASKVSASAAQPERVTSDIKQARSLIEKLDKEKGIAENLLTERRGKGEQTEEDDGAAHAEDTVVIRGAMEKTLKGLELLDILLTYLWRVHGIDYYGAVELKGLPKGLRTVRSNSDAEDGVTAGNDWVKKVDEVWKKRLSTEGQDPLIPMLGRDRLEKVMNDTLENFVRKIKDEKYGWKYGCGAKGCTKLFHGPEYVFKHLKLKHQDLVTTASAKVQEEVYENNYMNDPDAPLPAAEPPNRPLLRRDSMNRRRSDSGPLPDRPPQGPMRGMERFDRGMRDPGRYERGLVPPEVEREPEEERFERGAMEGDRFARPPRDVDPFEPEGGREGFPPPMMGRAPFDDRPPFEGPPIDTPMFDPFDGPPIRPPFGPGVPEPPPMLIPLPGAGPLGPFVPAPPEVAMRMMRERGGPPPPFFDGFEGPFEPPPFDVDGPEGGPSDRGGGLRGRPRGRGQMPLGSPGMGLMPRPSMMIPIPPGIRHDPRRMKSYRDLDAPDDEVTVIDYRSL